MDLMKPIYGGDEVVIRSPFSLVYAQPETEQVINIVMGMKNPINVEAMKRHLMESPLVKHPRFTSLLVKPDPNGWERWRRIREVIRIEDHVIIHRCEEEVKEEGEVVNTYLAKVAAVGVSNMSRDKPPWEIHVFSGGSVNFIVMRVHHSIGDGVSIMSMLVGCFGGGCVGKEVVGGGLREGRNGGWWEVVKRVGLTVKFVLEMAGRSMWVSDDHGKSGLGGERLELLPKVEVSVEFKLQDLRSIKKVVPNATANDVLLGVISCGLSRYLKVHSLEALCDGHPITGIVMVNLRKTPGLIKASNLTDQGSWGNKLGTYVVTLNYYDEEKSDPLDHVRRAKAMMDKKKKSFEAQVIDTFYSLQPYFTGIKGLVKSTLTVGRNTTFMLSNIMGPQQEISIAGNPVTYIKLSTSTLSNAVTMHMVTYMGMANLQIMVPKDVVRDPVFLAKCFQDSLTDMIKSMS